MEQISSKINEGRIQSATDATGSGKVENSKICSIAKELNQASACAAPVSDMSRIPGYTGTDVDG
jgi:hypothetical protein